MPIFYIRLPYKKTKDVEPSERIEWSRKMKSFCSIVVRILAGDIDSLRVYTKFLSSIPIIFPNKTP